MNSQLWKTVFDNLDEDIVNSAAERFGKVNFSCENPGDYPADSNPTEYKYSEKRHRSRFIIAAGGVSAAAAVAAGVFFLRGTGAPDDMFQPLSNAASSAQATEQAVSQETGEGVSISEEMADPRSEPQVDTEWFVDKTGFNRAVFDEYFYGSWDLDGGAYTLQLDYMPTLQLGYTPTVPFSHSAGAVVLEMGSDPDGGYMLALTDFGYDVYFVPNDDQDTLQVYYNVTWEEGSTLLSGIMEKDGELHDILGVDPAEYKRGAPLSSDNSLGYFGIERMAMEMGVTADWLLNQDIQFEGGDAELWTRSVWFDGWDTVISLNTQTDYSVTLRMRYALAGNETKTQFFDVTFEKENDGSWFMRQVQTSPLLYFGTWENDSYEVTRTDIVLFKQYFTGFWKGADEITPNLTLIYANDIFTPAEYFAGIREVGNGYAMYHVTARGLRVYYIDKDNPQIMYLYDPDKDGFSEPDSCTAVYERGLGKGYAGSIRYSYLGLERYKLMHNESSGGMSLADAISNALNDYATEPVSIWSASNYTSAMEGWDGYRIVEKSDSLVLFSYQRFNRVGESNWVTQELVRDGENWTLAKLTEGVLTAEDDTAPEEVDMVPFDWSEDQEIAEMAARESEGVYDGR